MKKRKEEKKKKREEERKNKKKRMMMKLVIRMRLEMLMMRTKLVTRTRIGRWGITMKMRRLGMRGDFVLIKPLLLLLLLLLFLL